jgi:hypothetical protein
VRRLLCLGLVGAAAALASARAQAQERTGSSYVIAGSTFSRQEGVTGETSVTYVTAPGGTTSGWTVAAGVFVSRGLSLEGEVSSTGMMRAREPSRYGMTFNEERRDRFFGVNARFHVPLSGRVCLEPMAGFVVIRHERWSQTEYLQYWLTPQQTSIVGPRVREDLPTRTGLSAGADLRLGGEHLALVPSFRVRVADLGEEIVSAYPGGFPRWTISPGISARIRF